MRPIILPHGGYGLGNDLIPLGKAYLLAKDCNGILLDMSWRENKRGYKKYFRTSFVDPLVRRLLWKVMPRIAFPVTHSTHDLSREIKDFCAAHNLYSRKTPCLITVTGIDGGPETVYGAKNYLLKRLLNTSYTLDNLSLIGSFLKPERITIGIHIRLGDFWEIGSRSYAGVVNTRLPVQWYIDTIKSLSRELGEGNVQFILATDSPLSNDLLEIESQTGCSIISRIKNSDVSDLLALSQSDLILCSSSTYSMWAAFLGNAYYIWYEPNLLKTRDGYCLRLAQMGASLKAGPADIDMPLAPLFSNLSNQEIISSAPDTYSYRGHPVGDSGRIPEALLNSLRARIHEKQPSRDLIRGGVVMSNEPE